MPENDRASRASSYFSVVIVVYNDWEPLADCLRALKQQTEAPDFEVVIVDDGSEKPAPALLQQWNKDFPLVYVRQPHVGIPSARNRGIQASRGAIILFTDADCQFRPNCLAALAAVIGSSPQHNYFQLHLTGDCSSLVGRAEELRLTAIQNHMLQPDGRIRYLNTAAFAIRRTQADIKPGLFNPAALRGEDTLLLTDLIERRDLPFFVIDATVRHVISLSLFQCFAKDVRAAWLEGRAYALIAARGVRVRMTFKERIHMLLSTWQTARQLPTGRTAWFVFSARQSLQRCVSFIYQCMRIRTRASVPLQGS